MHKIGIKYNGEVIASEVLSDEAGLATMAELFEKKFGLDIGEYMLSECERTEGCFFIIIRSEDYLRISRDAQIKKLGL